MRSTRSAWAGALVALVAIALIGVPFAYRVATEPPPAGPSLVPAVTATAAPSNSQAAGPETPIATGLSVADRELEQLRIATVLEDVTGPSRCDVELIPMARNRSVTLFGRVEADDHAGWVFTCPNEAGDRTRYFQLVSGVEVELAGTGADYQGGLSYAGEPGGTLETRWIVSGGVLSGEVEMLAAPTTTDTLTIVVLLDLRGSWQGQPLAS